MKDIQVSVGMGVVGATVALAYAIRVLRSGPAHHPRARSYGGTIFLGLAAMDLGYWMLDPLARRLHRAGVRANRVTLFALGPGIVAGIAVACGEFGLAALLATVAAGCDALDGLLARLQGPRSEVAHARTGGSLSGRALDSIVDRVTEAALLVGLCLALRFSAILTALAALALVGSNLVSYVSAQAESMNAVLPRGWMRRAERAVCLVTGCWLTSIATALAPHAPALERHLPIGLALLLIAVGANASALLRAVALFRLLGARDRAGHDFARAERPAGSSAAPAGGDHRRRQA